jgi:hypothetical protein
VVKKLMREKETDSREKEEQPDHTADERPAVEQSEHPAPGNKHEREPDAENIMPAVDGPGTF